MMIHEETGVGQRNPGTGACSEWTDRSPSEAVLRAVAAASGRSPIRDDGHDPGDPLDPLYDAIDPDALDALFASASCDTSAPVRVEFTYCGYRVSVDSTGRVDVGDR